MDLHEEYTCQHCKRQVKPWMSLTYFLETGEKVVIRYCTFPDCRKETEVASDR